MLAGCVSPAETLTARVAQAVLDQDDPETVAQGAPAYLLLVDGLVADAPEDPKLLLAGARLYGAYAGAFIDDPPRAQRLTARARAYAGRALCAEDAALCALPQAGFAELEARLARLDDPAPLYALAVAWLGWIQARAGDWDAIAELPKARAVLERVAVLDPGHDRGAAQLYLGVLESLLPAAAGGRPERAREHFERALVYSGGRNLAVKVAYAERYARARLDRTLHDRLLGEVLAADPRAPGLTLVNTLAQRRAAALLAGADGYF